MKIIKGLENIPEFREKTAVAIGNFDGVHLGHKKILETLVSEATKNNLTSVVMTFSPHPKKVVGKEPILMIQSLEQRLGSIRQFNVRAALILHFDRQLANRTAQEFIRHLVLEPLNAAEIIVGENFCFGKNRQGCNRTLHRLAQANGFRVHIIPPVTIAETRVSSSLIREFLQKGQVEKANDLLGRPYEIEGTVIQGQSRGKNLGFPTANIQTANEIVPGGVFVSNTVINGQAFMSLTNIGQCPTFDQKGNQVETYLMNFSSDIYGQPIKVQFLKKIRDEKKFSSPLELTRQIQKDLAFAGEYFKIR